MENGYTPAVRHAFSDLWDHLRRRLECHDIEQDWCARWDAWHQAGCAGEPPQPQRVVDWAPEGAWLAAARDCAQRLVDLGRPDLANAIRNVLKRAPNMIAALASRDLEQYRAAKEDERIALERLNEICEDVGAMSHVELPSPDDHPQWLRDLASEIHSLIREFDAFGRFREMVAIAIDARTPSRIVLLDGSTPDSDESARVPLLPIPDRPLRLPEKYLVLAAIHDEGWKGEKVDPRKDACDACDHILELDHWTRQRAIAYAVVRSALVPPVPLRARALKRLKRDVPIIRDVIADVRRDLMDTAAGGGNPASEQQTVEADAASEPSAGNARSTGQSLPAPQYVTLDQIAAIVSRSKRTLEKYKPDMPPPAVSGGGRGKPDEWIWSEVRPWLIQTFDRDLPETFPNSRA